MSGPEETGVPPAVPDLEGDLRDRILAVAIKCFADRGYGRTSMREVSEAAGCTKPALYYHFGSKEELFRAAVSSCLTGLRPFVEVVVAMEGSVRERVRAFAQALFDALQANPAQMRLMLVMQTRPDQSQPDIDFAHYHQLNQALIRSLFEQGVRTGEVRADVDLDEAVMVLTGALHSRVFLAMKGVEAPPDVPDRLVDILFSGIAGPAVGAS